MNFPGKRLLIDSRLYRFYKWCRAWFAHYRYGRPSRNMIVIGVTGTDGKTTTSHLIHWILQHSLGKTMMVGTAGVIIGDNELAGVEKMTSYDPMDLQALLARGYQSGCKYAVLEVSSHGLHQLRFAGIKFHLGVLTNITPEHLDYHGTYEDYHNAKKLLFDYVAASNGQAGSMLLPSHQQDIAHRREQYAAYVTHYGLTETDDIYADTIRYTKNDISAKIHLFGETESIIFPMVGQFNVYNMLAACGVAAHLGVPMNQIIDVLTDFPGISGRQQHMVINQIDWYVDFAHTPEGLRSILTYLQTIKGSGRLWCLFGAPGMRDPYKRPEMGKVVDMLADNMIITDDDAADEDRFVIIDQIKQGVTRSIGDTYQIIPERREAIAYVAKHAREGDVVLLAGKGHETVLLTNTGKIPRSDMGVLKECLDVSQEYEV